jgi:hypothetical protein
MNAKTNFKAIILTGMTIISSIAFAQNNESKVWVSFENNNSVPAINNRGNLVSVNPAMNELISRHNIKGVDRPLSNSRNSELKQVIELTCDCDQNTLISDLKAKANLVKRVEKAPVYETLDMPNDYTVAFGTDYALDLINANAAWDITHGNSEVRIGVSDQNFYSEHEELAGKFNYYDATNTATKTHGTAVAIIAGGNTNNGIGKSSIGYNTSLGLYRMNFNDVLAASYAGCKVVNLSWASGCSFNPYVQTALNEIYNNGTFIVASAGNGTTCGSASNLVYPAAYQNVFAVTSIGQNDNHEKTIGNPSTTHQHNASVDLCAPGYDVPLSTAPGFYSLGNGSSFAAPFVSGTVALMMAANPCLKNDDIEYILKSTALNIDSLNPNYAGLLGAGRLNAAAAVEMARDYKKLVLTSFVNPGCDPNAGSITIDITGGNAPYSIVWNNGDTTSVIEGLSEGTYSVVVADSNNCRMDSLTVTLSYPSLSLIPTITNESAVGANDGSIDITFTGDSVLSYTWSNGATTEDIFGLAGGEYFLNLQTASGCAVGKSFTVATLTDTTTNSGDNNEGNSSNTGDDSSNNSGTDTTTTSNPLPPLYNNDNAMGFIGADNTIENQTANQTELEAFEMIVYPNPAVDHATVKWNGNAKVLNVLNANGQTIMSEELNEMIQINLTDLTSGMYQIQIIDFQNQMHTAKLIVQ